MSHLLDTHTLIWASTAPQKLSIAARQLISDGENDIVVSTISFWEIALKYSLNKLTLVGITPDDFPQAAQVTGFRLLDLSPSVVSTYHKDPFDQLLIWQAI